MQKIGNITPTADANGEWTNGNVAAGTAPTILDAAWLNTVQRELSNVVTGGGLVLDPADDAQVLAALKKNFLQTGNNFSEIKSAGTNAQAAALLNLGLGSASQRAVGTGTNQIPDMASFLLGSMAGGGQGGFKLPTGHIVQYGSGVTGSTSGGFTQNYTVPFPTQTLQIVPVVYAVLGVPYSATSSTSSRISANINVVDKNGNGVGGVAVGYISIGY